MAHQDVALTTKIELRFDHSGNSVENVLHAKSTTPPSESQLDALYAAIENWVNSGWKPLASQGFGFVGATLTDLNSLNGIRKSYAPSVEIAGAIVSDGLAGNVTFAVKEDVGHRGKGIAGRVFWIGLAENQVTGDYVIAAVAASIRAALIALNTAVALVIPFTGLSVAHLVVNHARPNPAQSELVRDFMTMDLVLDSQRDRLTNHKKHKRHVP